MFARIHIQQTPAILATFWIKLLKFKHGHYFFQPSYELRKRRINIAWTLHTVFFAHIPVCLENLRSTVWDPTVPGPRSLLTLRRALAILHCHFFRFVKLGFRKDCQWLGYQASVYNPKMMFVWYQQDC